MGNPRNPRKARNPEVDFGFYGAIPRLVRTGYKELNPLQKWLYVCLKDLCGEGGTCFRTIPILALECGLSRGFISEAIPLLQRAGLIHATKKRRGNSMTKGIWHITIVDVWGANGKAHPTKKDTKESSLCELSTAGENSPSEHESSPDEHSQRGEYSLSELECSSGESEALSGEALSITVSGEAEEVDPSPDSSTDSLPPSFPAAAAASDNENAEETTGTLPPAPPPATDFPIATPPTPTAPSSIETPVPLSPLPPGSVTTIGKQQTSGVVLAVGAASAPLEHELEDWQLLCAFFDDIRGGVFVSERDRQSQEDDAREILTHLTLEQARRIKYTMDNNPNDPADDFYRKRGGGAQARHVLKHYPDYLQPAGINLRVVPPTEQQQEQEQAAAWRPPSRPTRPPVAGVAVAHPSPSPPTPAFDEQQRLVKLQEEARWVADHLDSIARGFTYKPHIVEIIHRRRLALVAAGMTEFAMEGDNEREEQQQELPEAAMVVVEGHLSVVRA